MIKKIIILLIVFFCSLITFSSQEISIRGTVKNEKKQPVISAGIILKKHTGEILSYTRSDDTGKYSFQIPLTDDELTLQITSLDYEQMNLKVGNNQEKQNIEIILSPRVTEIKEVVIKNTPPVRIKKDTIVFNAKSFSQGNEQVVEDLLKKIPGLNVESDGTIKVGNIEVEKVMIEGDDFFDKGYKILTKNMPVNPIDKIELIQRYSNNKHLKGIEHSDKVALNLTLKEDAKRTWFGNISGGYNILKESRHEFKGNLMNFGKKSKYYVLTHLNNIGIDAVGEINDLVRPYRVDEAGSIGDDQRARSLLDISSDVPNLKQKRVNLNNAKIFSVNTILSVSKKTKIKLLGFLHGDENSFFRSNFQSFNFGETFFENSESFVSRKNQFTGFGKADLTHDFSTNKTLEYTGKINHTSLKGHSDLLFNGQPITESLKSRNQLIDQKIVYTNKLKPNRVFLVSGRYINEKTPQNYGSNQFLFGDIIPDNADHTRQYSKNHMQFFGVESHLMERMKNGNLLEIKLGSQYRRDDLNTQLQLLDQSTVISSPENYRNDVKYSTHDVYLSAKYRWKFNRFSLFTQTSFHQLYNYLKYQDINRSQNPFFIIPKIGLDWEINDKHKIITSYTYNTTNSEILDVYPNFVQTSYRSLEKGLPDFNQLNSSNAVLNYSYGGWGDSFFANTFVVYTRNNDFYSSNSIIHPNYSASEKIIIKDRELLSVNSSIDRYLKPIKSNLKVNLSLSKSNYKNIINGSDLREIKSTGTEYGAELRSGFKGIFNYHGGIKWNHYRVKTETSNSYTNNMMYLDFSLMFNNRFNVQLQSERYLFGNLEKGSNEYYFFDIEARYVIKENKLTLSVSGNNLFNTTMFRDYSISDISISRTEYRLQPRYILLKAEYRF